MRRKDNPKKDNRQTKGMKRRKSMKKSNLVNCMVIIGEELLMIIKIFC